jgi:hypothetical protein
MDGQCDSPHRQCEVSLARRVVLTSTLAVPLRFCACVCFNLVELEEEGIGDERLK